MDGFGLKYSLTEELLDMFFLTVIEALLCNQPNTQTHTTTKVHTHTHMIYTANDCH